MNLAESYLGEKMIEQGIKLIMHNPEKNLVTMVNWAEKVARDPNHRNMINNVRRFMENKDTNWYRFAHHLLTTTHPRVKERMAINFFLNSTLLGVPKQKEMEKKLGMGIPWAILMDPTERCNLHCTGCWAGDYQTVQELDFDLMDRICSEAEDLGIYFIVVSGGEPLCRKKDLLELARRHPAQVFHLFTNGTMITDKFCEEMVKVGNMTVAISIEGFEKTTDERRGKGVFQKVMRSMDRLREHGLLFGFSTTYTRKNTEEIASDEFVDLMVEKGAAFGWYFTYIPIGKDVDLEYMATPEQRAYMFDRIQHFRQTKPILLVDFWNDGEAAGGCIAGGRRYFHINAAGDVEPCAFVHYSTCNIKDTSLVEALRNPLFRAYQKRQPFDQNLRRPCPLIDHPEAMEAMVKEAGARSTQLTANETVEEFVAKMRSYAEAWGGLAEELWASTHQEEQRKSTAAV